MDVLLKRQDIEAFYRHIRANHLNGLLSGNMVILARKIAVSYKINMNYFKLKKCIEILDELELLKAHFKNDYHVHIDFNKDVKEKTSLGNSRLYRKLQLFRIVK